MQKGILLALDEAKAKSRAEGKAEALLRQLSRRWGPVSPAVKSRVRAVESCRLDEWMDHLMDAYSLAEVFDLSATD
ncbi:MAG: hypothetical protein FD153_2102 [Rhodospirillaceae bacterium]|nr:MAG: hypothetical protein FD153_2102 [Rhodospirillaceae bacterium]